MWGSPVSGAGSWDGAAVCRVSRASCRMMAAASRSTRARYSSRWWRVGGPPGATALHRAEPALRDMAGQPLVLQGDGDMVAESGRGCRRPRSASAPPAGLRARPRRGAARRRAPSISWSSMSARSAAASPSTCGRGGASSAGARRRPGHRRWRRRCGAPRGRCRALASRRRLGRLGVSSGTGRGRDLDPRLDGRDRADPVGPDGQVGLAVGRRGSRAPARAACPGSRARSHPGRDADLARRDHDRERDDPIGDLGRRRVDLARALDEVVARVDARRERGLGDGLRRAPCRPP